MRLNYDMVLIEKEGNSGLTRSEAIDAIDLLDDTEFEPISIDAKNVESTAMGFITSKAAEKLDFDFAGCGLVDYVAGIMDDMNLETDTGDYEFGGVEFWLTRNIGEDA